MKANGFGGSVFAGAMGALLMACQPGGTPAPVGSAPVAVEHSPQVSSPADVPSESPSASSVEESSAIASFRKYCYDTQSDTAKVTRLIEVDALQPADEAANGYSRAPQRGRRQMYTLPSKGNETSSFNLVINNMGVCGVQVSGEAAAALEADVIKSFNAFRVPAPQNPAVRAGVFIPYGSSVSEQNVRRHGLINTMTSDAKSVAMVIYIPPLQAEEVLANARRQ
ncbi:hypothetical protein VDS28_18890 [Xanthomonas campestris pv. campestris]|nr:hypothetical protein [Xanthomonas campestris pv. campestris]